MTEEAEQKGFVPCGGLYFPADGHFGGVGAEEIERELSHDSKVFWSAILSRSIGIFLEHDIENPVQLVLYGPMRPHGLKQFLRGNIPGENEVADGGLVGRPGRLLSARGNTRYGDDSWKVLACRKRLVPNDSGFSPFAPIVGGRLKLLGCVPSAASREAAGDGSKEVFLVLLKSQHIIATLFEHGRRECPAAKKRVGRDGTVLQPQHFKHFKRGLRLVAPRRLARGKGYARLGGEGIDQMHWRSALAPLVGTTKRFTIDCNNTAQIQPMELAERRHETPKHLLERYRLQHAEHPAEGVVTRDAMFQREEPSQQIFLVDSKIRHVRRAFRPAQRRSQRDDQYLQQFVRGIIRTRVAQPLEKPLQFAHSTPLTNRESSSESCSQIRAIGPQNPYAIPLPSGGG